LKISGFSGIKYDLLHRNYIDITCKNPENGVVNQQMCFGVIRSTQKMFDTCFFFFKKMSVKTILIWYTIYLLHRNGHVPYLSSVYSELTETECNEWTCNCYVCFI